MTLTPTDTRPGTMDAGFDLEALARLSGRIREDVEQGRIFGASILVAREGKIGYRDTIGEVAPGRPAASDDIYLMMSLSKAFTASLVLRAVDRGQLTLDTRACEILPGFAANGKQRVTIRHLLTHTAGTYANVLPPPPLTVADMGNLEKNVAAISVLPAAYRPGERVVYNPFAGYAALGQILVAIDDAGRSFREIARQDLFAPLGMSDTSYGLAVDAPRRVPVSFTDSSSTPASAAVAHMLNSVNEHTEHPAGCSFGTIDDVFRFTEALRGGGASGTYRLLSSAMFDYASQNHTGDLVDGAWAFDREQKDLPDSPANFSLLGGYVRGRGHHSSALGFTASPRAFGAVGGGSTFWMVDPERDLTFVFLSAGFIDGLGHFLRLQRLTDLALAACER
jgi:CubicO group peptidase (beta-lactamase class C family)